MSQAQGRLIPIYLIDTCSVTALDGKNALSTNPRPPLFSPSERQVIWTHLEEMTRQGFLKLISEVRTELKDWDPDAIPRFSKYPKHRLPPRGDALHKTYRVIFADPFNRRLIGSTRREKGDPWLIAAAKQYGYTIITEELHASVRARRRGVRIPDVCEREGISYISLRELAVQEGWCR